MARLAIRSWNEAFPERPCWRGFVAMAFVLMTASAALGSGNAAPAANGAEQESIRQAFSEFDRTAEQGGVPALIALRKSADPIAAERFAEMSVVESGNPEFPFALELGGERISLLKKCIGEGAHSRVFLTDRGTAMKLTKQASSARGLLMAAWAAPILEENGIRVAKIYRVEPTGLYMEQELVSGSSLQKKFDEEWGTAPPPEIRDQVFRVIKTNLDLAQSRGISFNIKADAFQIGPDGRLILVDITPSDRRLDQYRSLFNTRQTLGEDKFWSKLFSLFSQRTMIEKLARFKRLRSAFH